MPSVGRELYHETVSISFAPVGSGRVRNEVAPFSSYLTQMARLKIFSFGQRSTFGGVSTVVRVHPLSVS